uniref:LAGLIDADG endonuclease n=1 Tax=Clavaria fumosa TaxID=264083 RepID=A0A7T3PCX9_9AGAR|nr:LAGLIDADG endonuclease [Clavaria fumosa]QPZ51152.1 LAGLIDADG endonuclease [Clavaria fumosa]
MNLGLSEKIKSEFINITPVKRPLILTNNIPEPNWIVGFLTCEGNFDVNIHKSNNKIGYRSRLRFRVYQHERDIQLLELLIKYLGAGKLEKDSRKPSVCLTISKFLDITNIIIPFFKKNSIPGIKQLDYLDWCKIAKLMTEGLHLTKEGLDLIIKIKSGMNKSRKYNNI